MLGRSKSLRLLRGGRKEARQQDAEELTPPSASSQMEADRLKAATPVTRADSRAHTPDMLQRPKTSGGPERGRLFHKKVAPIPTETDDSKLEFPFASPNSTTATIYLTAEVTESREGIIGIALGSPTMNSHWNSTTQNPDFVTGTVTEISSNADPKQETQKPKLSRWKSIFGRKAPAPEPKQSFYQLAQSVTPVRADSHHDDESVISRSASAMGEVKDDSHTGSPPSFKPEIRESRKAPKGQEQPKQTRPRALTATRATTKSTPSLFRSVSSPKPPPKDLSPAVPKLVVSAGSPPVTSPVNEQKPVLDVDIPSIQMERYSVMFGSLLQTNSNRSSLLLRRQGNPEKVKPLNGLSVMNEEPSASTLKPRRATSPSHPKSPSVTLSLFPQPIGHRTPSPRVASINRSRPLQRSKTAPAVSPSRKSFNLEPPPVEPARPSKDLEPKALSAGLSESADASPLPSATPNSRNSFDSEPEEVSVVVGRASNVPWRPQVAEPDWEIVSKPSLRSALTSHPPGGGLEQNASSSAPPTSTSLPIRTDSVAATLHANKASPRSADQSATPKSSTSEPKPQSQGTTQATTVGIARSVSVSRASPRSAELLKPSLVRTMTERSVSPGLGRVGDHKPLTPTLVELRNRKSQRVQLVDA